MLLKTAQNLFDLLKDKEITNFPDNYKELKTSTELNKFFQEARGKLKDNDLEELNQLHISIANDRQVTKLYKLLKHHANNSVVDLPRDEEKFAELHPNKIRELVDKISTNISEYSDQNKSEKNELEVLAAQVIARKTRETRNQATRDEFGDLSSATRDENESIVQSQVDSLKEQKGKFKQHLETLYGARRVDGKASSSAKGHDLDLVKGEVKDYSQARVSVSVWSAEEKENQIPDFAPRISISGDNDSAQDRSNKQFITEQLSLKGEYFENSEGVKFLKEIKGKDGKFSYEVKNGLLEPGEELTVKTPRVDKNGKKLVPPVFDVVVLDHNGEAKSVEIIKIVNGKEIKLDEKDKAAGVSKIDEKWLNKIKSPDSSQMQDFTKFMQETVVEHTNPGSSKSPSSTLINGNKGPKVGISS